MRFATLVFVFILTLATLTFATSNCGAVRKILFFLEQDGLN